MFQQPRYAKRFAVAYATLGLVAVAACVGAILVLARPAPPAVAHCAALPGAKDPIVTAISFIENAVERKNTEASYGLVIPSLHAGLTCRQWANGKLPVAEYRDVDWDHAAYKQTAGGTGQLVFDVTLEHRGDPRKTHFLLELRQVGSRWLVGTWDRA